MHIIALIALVLAGGVYCLAAVRRWRGLGAAPGVATVGVGWLLGLGFGGLTLALVASLLENGPHDFAYAVLGIWSAMAALHFALGFIAGPTRVLLVLPVGCMAILLAMAGLVRPHAVEQSSAHAMVVLHSVCMATHLAVALVAGGAGGLYLLAVRQLKRASQRAFRLPALPLLELITERSLIIATALLMAGLATGGAAIASSHSISLTHPSIIIAFMNLLLLVALFALRFSHRLANRIGRRGLALVAVQTMVLSAMSTIGLQVVVHA